MHAELEAQRDMLVLRASTAKRNPNEYVCKLEQLSGGSLMRMEPPSLGG